LVCPERGTDRGKAVERAKPLRGQAAVRVRLKEPLRVSRKRVTALERFTLRVL